MAPSALEEKEAFFRQLRAMQEVNEDADEDFPKREVELRRRSRGFFPRQQPAALPSSTQEQSSVEMIPQTADTPLPPDVIQATPAARSKSATVPPPSAATGSPSFIADTPVPGSSKGPVHPRRTATHPLPPTVAKLVRAATTGSSPLVPAKEKKRKRSSSQKVVPESAKIFKELSFFYIPNNDVAPLRKMRISRAQDYGAQWVRELDAATHVIVDGNLAWKDIKLMLSPATLGTAPPTIVCENFPLDCISFGIILNPKQSKYRVSGAPLPEEVEAPVTGPAMDAPASSGESLQVKARPQNNPEKWDYVPPAGTPTRSEASSGRMTGRLSVSTAPESLQSSVPARQPLTKVVIPSSQSVPNDTEIAESPNDRHTICSSPRQVAPSEPGDELSNYIQLVRQYKDVPLDEDEEDDSSVKDSDVDESGSEGGSDDEHRRKRRSADKTVPRGQKSIRWEDNFACNRGGTLGKSIDAENPNSRTIEVLQKMCDYYTRINDHWRMTAYRKAITVLRRQKVKITTEEQAYQLPTIGPRLAKKIEEIATTNRLQRLEYAEKEPMDQVLEVFIKIYGVGNNQATKWIAQGFTTLDDLRTKAKLNTNQRLGIDHYDDLNTRIPRREVEAIGDHVIATAAKIDQQVELLIGGSYRRGADSSGDVDFIITKKGTTSSGDLIPFLDVLVKTLTREGFLTAELASFHSHRVGKDGHGSKWHGCCVLPPGDKGKMGGIWRRVDFLVVPETEYGAALIYFTGNDIFNRSMRLLASKKGMRLNQRGLYKEVMRGPGRVKVTEGELVEGRDEKKIFELLQVKWREPWERWC